MTRWPDPPQLSAAFYKAHGLGNDYLVFEEGDGWLATPEAVSLVCDRFRGIGADGLVVLLADRDRGIARLRMFNPDGSEFERSGNGLRVLASYLAGQLGMASPFAVEVGGQQVALDVHGRSGAAHDVSVQMGRARIGPAAVGLDDGTLDSEGRLTGPAGEALRVVPVSVGNPHLVVLVDDPTGSLLARLGPFLVGHPSLAHGANVQLACSIDPETCRALIWERGVGPTSASGTSACAVAVALVTEGRLARGEIEVRMPGGSLDVTVSTELDVVLRGPVEEVCTGRLTHGFIAGVGT